MDSNFRKKDTLTIFNERWQANADNNKNIANAKVKQQTFNKRLYGTDNSVNHGQQIQNNVNNLRQIQRDTFRDKF